MGGSFYPRRPYKPTKKDIKVINMFPRFCALENLIQKENKLAMRTLRNNKKNERANKKYGNALWELRKTVNGSLLERQLMKRVLGPCSELDT